MIGHCSTYMLCCRCCPTFSCTEAPLSPSTAEDFSSLPCKGEDVVLSSSQVMVSLCLLAQVMMLLYLHAQLRLSSFFPARMRMLLLLGTTPHRQLAFLPRSPRPSDESFSGVQVCFLFTIIPVCSDCRFFKLHYKPGR